MDTLSIRKRKRNRGSGQWRAYLLDEDEHGLWAYCPPGSLHHDEGGGSWRVPCPGLQLIPQHRWWVAWWWLDSTRPWCAADVCTPARLEQQVWSYLDLELDPVGDEDGFREVADEEEFVQAVREGQISSHEAKMAREAAGEVERFMRSLIAPFNAGTWQTLRTAASLDLAPLLTLE